MVRGRRMSDEESFGSKSQACLALFAMRSCCKVAEVVKIFSLLEVHLE